MKMKIVCNFFKLFTLTFFALNFAGCKENHWYDDVIDDDWIRYYGNEIIDSESINKNDMFHAIYCSNVKVVDCKISIGTSKENMTELTEQSYKLEPFSQYWVTYNPFVYYGNDTIYGEEETRKYYAIPTDCKLHIDVDYGNGEPAINLHCNLLYWYTYNYNESEHQCYNGNVSSAHIAIWPDDNTTYKMDTIKFPIDTDSCCITQGGTFDNPEIPAYTIKYWEDGKTVMRYLPVVYNIEATVTITVGDKDFAYTERIKDILMDKQKFTCDEDFNIYRVAKIGNQIWTIDNAYPITERLCEGDQILTSNFYGGCEYLFELFYEKYYHETKLGFHTAWDEDWMELLSYYGIQFPEKSISYEDFDKMYAHDTCMQKYFSSEGNWECLLSDFGWKYNEGYIKDTTLVGFNALPIGGYTIYRDNSGIVCGEDEFAMFKMGYNKLLIISSFYNGIARYNNSHVGAAIRMVKKD